LKNMLYSAVNLKENVEIVGELGTSHFSEIIVLLAIVKITETEPEQIFARTVANQAMTRRVASNSRRSKRKMAMPIILMVTLTSETMSHKMWFSRRLQRTRS
jgi:hypothetical protein